jgi:hypothetical protein
MSDVGGTYDFVVSSPMGEQTGTFTVVPSDDGSTFTGTLSGTLGSMEAEDGRIDGNVLTWTMQLTSPMPMKLEGTAEVNGDDVTGRIKAGFMGSMNFTATRQA